MPRYRIESPTGDVLSAVWATDVRGAMRETTGHAKLFGQATLKDGSATLMICRHAPARQRPYVPGWPWRRLRGYAKCEITPAGRKRLAKRGR